MSSHVRRESTPIPASQPTCQEYTNVRHVVSVCLQKLMKLDLIMFITQECNILVNAELYRS